MKYWQQDYVEPNDLSRVSGLPLRGGGGVRAGPVGSTHPNREMVPPTGAAVDLLNYTPPHHNPRNRLDQVTSSLSPWHVQHNHLFVFLVILCTCTWACGVSRDWARCTHVFRFCPTCMLGLLSKWVFSLCLAQDHTPVVLEHVTCWVEHVTCWVKHTLVCGVLSNR